MSQSPSPEHAPPAAAADALAAVDQVGEHAQVLADELAGGFDDIEAIRATAPEGFDASRDLDALLAAAAGGAMDGGYEMTHAEVADEPLPPADPAPVAAAAATPAVVDPVPVAPAPAAVVEPEPEPAADTAEALDELVATAFLETQESEASEPADAVAADTAETIDELLGAAFTEPDALAEDAPGDGPGASAADAANPIDDADAFAAALLETHAAEAEAVAPSVAVEAAVEAAPAAAAEAPAEAPDDVVAQAGPPQVNPERIQDAITAMEELLAQEAEPETDADAAADASESLESDASAAADAAAAAAAAADGEGVSEDELAGLFAAPDVAAGTGAPEVRALSDAVDAQGADALAAEDGVQDASPPIHPDAAAVDGEGSQASDADAPRMAFFPFGWMIALLALINRPLERLSDEWRLAVSGVALAVAVPGALLLSYALFLK